MQSRRPSEIQAAVFKKVSQSNVAAARERSSSLSNTRAVVALTESRLSELDSKKDSRLPPQNIQLASQSGPKQPITEKGFILGVMEDLVTLQDCAAIDQSRPIHQILVHKSALLPEVFESTFGNGVGLELGSTVTPKAFQREDGGKKVQIVTTVKDTERRRALMSTEQRSNSVAGINDYSSMKPVQMLDGLSEEGSHASQDKHPLEPRGPPSMDLKVQINRTEAIQEDQIPHFQVLASHFQGQIEKVTARSISGGNRAKASSNSSLTIGSGLAAPADCYPAASLKTAQQAQKDGASTYSRKDVGSEALKALHKRPVQLNPHNNSSLALQAHERGGEVKRTVTEFIKSISISPMLPQQKRSRENSKLKNLRVGPIERPNAGSKQTVEVSLLHETRVKKIRTGLENQKHLAKQSTNSLHSSNNSVRLNEDIMSAKIDSIKVEADTQNHLVSSSDSHVADQTSPTKEILVLKFESSERDHASLSCRQQENKMQTAFNTILATQNKDCSNEVTKINTPKRKSVLSRKSRLDQDQLAQAAMHSGSHTIQDTLPSLAQGLNAQSKNFERLSDNARTGRSVAENIPAADVDGEPMVETKGTSQHMTIEAQSSREGAKAEQEAALQLPIEIHAHHKPERSMDDLHASWAKRGELSPAQQELDQLSQRMREDDHIQDANYSTSQLLPAGSSQNLGNLTSVGNESFIHPPSPIRYMHNQLHSSALSSQNHAHNLQNQPRGEGVSERAPRLICDDERNAVENQSHNFEVVDVMHAGVGTQDFLELSSFERELSSQDNAHIEAHNDLSIRINVTDVNKLNKDLAGALKEQLNVTKSNLKLMKSGQGFPTVSCLCRELELTPEQFALAVQKYRRQPRVILKSETDENRILLVTRDGTSKDATMMQSIINGTMKVDGLSIKRVVAEHAQYFDMLKLKDEMLLRQRRKFMEKRNSSEPNSLDDYMGGCSSNRTIDRRVMSQQLAQFVQYGQEGELTKLSAATLCSKSQGLHSKECEKGGAQLDAPDGLYRQKLLNQQFLDNYEALNQHFDRQRVYQNQEFLGLGNQQSFFSHSYDKGRLNRNSLTHTDVGKAVMLQSEHLVSTQRGFVDNTLTSKNSLSPINLGDPHTMVNSQPMQAYETGMQDVERSHALCNQNIVAQMSSEQRRAQVGRANGDLTPNLVSAPYQDGDTFVNSNTTSLTMTMPPIENFTPEPKEAEPGGISKQNSENPHGVCLLQGIVLSKIEISRPSTKKSQSRKKIMEKHHEKVVQIISSENQTSPERKKEGFHDKKRSQINQLLKSNDLSAQSNQKLQSSAFKKQRTTTPHLRRKKDYEISFGDAQPDTEYLQQESTSQQDDKNFKRILKEQIEGKQQGAHLRAHRNSMSRDFEISTQRRYSNNVSGMNCDVDEESEAALHVQTSKLSAKNSLKGKKQAPSNQLQQRQAGRRSQIGTWSAALCKMSPGHIELKVNQSGQGHKKDAFSKEIQVIQSKRGMLAQISRTFSSALATGTHSKSKARQADRPSNGILSNETAVDPSCTSLHNIKSETESQLELAHQSRQAAQINIEYFHNQRHTSVRVLQNQPSDLGANQKVATRDLTVNNQQSENLDARGLQLQSKPLTGFNGARRKTTHQICQLDRQAVLRYSDQVYKAQDFEAKLPRPTSNQFGSRQNSLNLNMLCAHKNSGVVNLPLNESEVAISAGYDQLSDLPVSQFNHTGFFKRKAGQPLVRITNSSMLPERGAKVALKSASLFHLSKKRNNRVVSVRGRKRQADESREQELSGGYSSVEQMIKDLGDQKSELNLQLLKNVERRANFDSGLLYHSQPSGQRQAKATSSRCAVSTHGKPSTAQSKMERATTAADLSSQQNWAVVCGDLRGMKPDGSRSYCELTADDPVKKLVSLQRQGRLSEATRDESHLSAHCIRLRQQKLEMRKQMDLRAVGLYYNSRKHAMPDMARLTGELFRNADNSHIVDSFKKRHSMQENSLLKPCLDQSKPRFRKLRGPSTGAQ